MVIVASSDWSVQRTLDYRRICFGYIARREQANLCKRTERSAKKGSLPKWSPAFLEALKASGNVTYSCAHAGVGRKTVYERRAANEEFARLWDDALTDAIDAMLLEAQRRATQGINRKRFYKGEAILDP
jgi:hypothetical protein